MRKRIGLAALAALAASVAAVGMMTTLFAQGGAMANRMTIPGCIERGANGGLVLHRTVMPGLESTGTPAHRFTLNIDQAKLKKYLGIDPLDLNYFVGQWVEITGAVSAAPGGSEATGVIAVDQLAQLSITCPQKQLMK
jgi:hypothetical protein